mgnify:CR=1 FL=1
MASFSKRTLKARAQRAVAARLADFPAAPVHELGERGIAGEPLARGVRAFLKAPGDVVPGNRMRFFGIGNAQQLDNLLAYLRTFDGINQQR